MKPQTMRAPTIPKSFNFIREGSVVCGFEQKSNRAVQKIRLRCANDLKHATKRGEPPGPASNMMYTFADRNLLERRSVKLVPVVEIVQVHRILAGRSVVLQT